MNLKTSSVQNQRKEHSPPLESIIPKQKKSLPIRYFLTGVLFTLIYYVSGKFGLKLAFSYSSASPVWPGTAIALVVLLLYGYRYWPSILVGAFLVNLTTTGNPFTSFGIAIGNTMEALVGAYFANEFCDAPYLFQRAQSIFKFTLLVGLGSTAISATIGVTNLCLAGLAEWRVYPSIWFTWWLGNTTANLILSPALILWTRHWRIRWNRREVAEFALSLAALAAVSLVAFGPYLPTQVKNYPISFICIPPIIWSSYRVGPHGAVISTILLSVIAIGHTINGTGPFARESVNESLLLLQGFTSVMSLSALVLGAVVSERRRAEEELRRAHDDLEKRVQERTLHLSQAIDALHEEVTQHKYTEGALRESVMRYQTLFETAPDIIFVASIHGKILSVNPAFEKLAGWSTGDWLGKDLAPLIHPEELPLLSEKFKKVSAGEPLDGPFEVRILTKSGDYLVLESTLKAQVMGDAILGVLGIARDITERKRSEDKLLDNERELARAKAEREQLELFASVAAHDLQEPLQKIIAFGDLLKSECAPALQDSGLHYLDRMQNAARRMSRLITDLLVFSRTVASTDAADAVSLNHIIEEVVGDLEFRVKESGARIEIGQLPTLRANPVHMRELFQNLIANAIKFRKKEEPLRIEIKSKANTEEGFDIVVKDNGIGFDMKFAEKIFRPFERLHRRSEYEGSGIGLAICHRIVARLGGKITAEGAPGEGAVFIISVPSSLRVQDKASPST